MSDDDLRLIVEHGTRRALGHIAQGTRQQHGAANDPLQDDVVHRVMGDIDSAGAECYVARLLGLPWTGAEQYEAGQDPPDVGDFIEVKQTPVKGGCLIVPPDLHRDRAVVCVVGAFPAYHAVGWLWGVEATEERWWCAVEHACRRSPAFTIPQASLHPLQALINVMSWSTV